jgi:phosphoribosylamine--glycine ligase
MNIRKFIRILLVGKDARTDAMADALRRSGWTVELIAYTEFVSPGLVNRCDRVERGPFGLSGRRAMETIAAFARELRPDLVVIGPEEPLADGLVDEIRALGIPCFGPTRSLARIESSKAWTRELVSGHGIPGNPEYRVFRSEFGLREFLTTLGSFVVKPDGLTGGKGVRVSDEHFADMDDAYEYASALIHDDGCVIIEEKLEGEEFSLMSITDGDTVVHCPIVQDHKRAENGDSGPNTGGMGSYSCPDGSLPFLTPEDVAEAQRINELVVRAIHDETGDAYTGVLYGGFMATSDGVRLIEYNCRFGDPEAMNVLPLLRTDFVDLCLAVAKGNLSDVVVEFEPAASVCKYVVPTSYPYAKGHGDAVTIASDGLATPGLHCYWAATEVHDDGSIRLTGSRAVAFVGTAPTLVDAERLAEFGANLVAGEVRHRTDIGTSAALERRESHMKALRQCTTGNDTRSRH